MSHAERASTGDGAADVRAAAEQRGGSGREWRAGERVLTLLSTPLDLMILRALAERPMRLAELRRDTGLPAQTTLRGHLARLGEIRIVAKRPTQRMPYAVENELTAMGQDLLAVADRLERWLGEAPERPISLESGAAKGVVKAFVDGWSSTLMRGLAARPMSLTELDSRIPEHSYPALERRLASMRMAGLVEASPSEGAGTPYTVTEWARRGVGPLASAGNFELVHMRRRAAPITQVDVEAAFLLATPLVRMPEPASGSCQLEVEGDPAAVRERAGVSVVLREGAVVSCDSQLQPSPGTFAIGSTVGWFNAVNGGEPSSLRFGGVRGLAEGVVSGLHSVLGGP